MYNITILTALSKSQSPKIINGDLPPSSKDTFLRLLSAQDLIMTLPISVLPVKPSLRTSLWSAIAWPHWLPTKAKYKNYYFYALKVSNTYFWMRT